MEDLSLTLIVSLNLQIPLKEFMLLQGMYMYNLNLSISHNFTYHHSDAAISETTQSLARRIIVRSVVPSMMLHPLRIVMIMQSLLAVLDEGMYFIQSYSKQVYKQNCS